MITISNDEVVGIEHAVRGMRNPLSSWAKSDSEWSSGNWCEAVFNVGEEDLSLMKRLAKAGTDHRKYLRMIVVYADIDAPIYWWKEYDTYKVGTVANSCSTMHTIHKNGITPALFSLDAEDSEVAVLTKNQKNIADAYFTMLEELRSECKTGDAKWRMLIQLLPCGFNQKRTVMLNYEVLRNMYHSRLHHKLIEWRTFCRWVETLPYSELITGEEYEVSTM